MTSRTVSFVLAGFVFASIVVGAVAIWSKSHDQIANSHVISDVQKRQGLALRSDVEQIYQELKKRNALKPSGQGRNFITDLVAKYIPSGTPLEAAEAVLRAAGCKIADDQVQGVGSAPAIAARLIIEQQLISNASLSVYLTPSPSNRELVGTLTAEITISSL